MKVLGRNCKGFRTKFRGSSDEISKVLGRNSKGSRTKFGRLSDEIFRVVGRNLGRNHLNTILRPNTPGRAPGIDLLRDSILDYLNYISSEHPQNFVRGPLKFRPNTLKISRTLKISSEHPQNFVRGPSNFVRDTFLETFLVFLWSPEVFFWHPNVYGMNHG